MLCVLCLFSPATQRPQKANSGRRLVGKVDAHTHLEAARIEWIVWDGKVVVATEDLAVGMRVDHKEAGLLQLEVGIDVGQQEVAALLLLLGVEGHRGGVVGRGIVLGVVISVDAYLHMQHLGNHKLGIEVAVDREGWKWQHGLVT